MQLRSRSPRLGCPFIAVITPGHAATDEQRSRSIRSRAPSTSNRSWKTSVLPCASAETRVINPPIQNIGIVDRIERGSAAPFRADRVENLRTNVPCVWMTPLGSAVEPDVEMTTSQSAATRTMVPLGLALGIGAGYMIAMWQAVAGVLFFPANGTQIAAAEADDVEQGRQALFHAFGDVEG